MTIIIITLGTIVLKGGKEAEEAEKCTKTNRS
jgi:hypothetical protein